MDDEALADALEAATDRMREEGRRVVALIDAANALADKLATERSQLRDAVEAMTTQLGAEVEFLELLAEQLPEFLETWLERVEEASEACIDDGQTALAGLQELFGAKADNLDSVYAEITDSIGRLLASAREGADSAGADGASRLEAWGQSVVDDSMRIAAKSRETVELIDGIGSSLGAVLETLETVQVTTSSGLREAQLALESIKGVMDSVA